jgi:hypothetical protein
MPGAVGVAQFDGGFLDDLAEGDLAWFGGRTRGGKGLALAWAKAVWIVRGRLVWTSPTTTKKMLLGM